MDLAAQDGTRRRRRDRRRPRSGPWARESRSMEEETAPSAAPAERGKTA